MTPPSAIAVTRCDSCHTRFLPRPAPCPRCGSTQLRPETISGEGKVVAATEVAVPPTGWPAPHRLALVELGAGIRVLALVEGDLPTAGSSATVERRDDRYVVLAAGS